MFACDVEHGHRPPPAPGGGIRTSGFEPPTPPLPPVDGAVVDGEEIDAGNALREGLSLDAGPAPGDLGHTSVMYWQ
jgi:hypothetical protein